MKIAPPSRSASPGSPSPPARGAGREGGARFLEILGEANRAHARPPAAATPAPQLPDKAATATPTERLRDAVATAMKSESVIDSLLAAAQRGRTFSSSELLAMQATVFRYSQTVEVVSRATDRLVGGIKQTLQTPV